MLTKKKNTNTNQQGQFQLEFKQYVQIPRPHLAAIKYYILSTQLNNIDRRKHIRCGQYQKNITKHDGQQNVKSQESSNKNKKRAKQMKKIPVHEDEKAQLQK